MSQVIRYGVGSQLELEVPSDVLLADCTFAKVQPLDDPVAAVAAALAQPVDFPPLAQATIPGDQIVLPLGRGVPQSDAVIAGVVHTLLEGNVTPSDITIVSEDPLPSDPYQLTRLLPADVASAIQLEVHDPTNDEELCYLAASQDGLPIYFNRRICQADVVLPITCLRLRQSLAFMGAHGGLFPGFSDQATRQRFYTPNNIRQESRLEHRRQEAEEAAWLLGVQFALQIVPGPGQSILHILAGDCSSIAKLGQQLCQAAWLYNVPQKASLVVASIEGGPEDQTWENFARALFAASQIVRNDGTIVLCTALHDRPGPALQRLRGAAMDQRALRDVERDGSPDAVPASLLLETRENAHVYLISALEGDLVEDLGLGYVADPRDVDRLSRQHDSCILLANAHRALGQISP
jgi:hypothetical protein